MAKKRRNTFWKSKRKEKRYWKSRRMRRANSLAERTMQTVTLENALDTVPLWRQKEMTMRVFIVVAMVVKIRRPAWGVENHVPQRGTQRIHTLMCPQSGSEIHAVRQSYLGPEAPPWSPDEDEDDDEIDSSRWPSMYCTSCQEDVLLLFGKCWQCPKCKVFLT